jgi:hypothetical protein
MVFDRLRNRTITETTAATYIIFCLTRQEHPALPSLSVSAWMQLLHKAFNLLKVCRYSTLMFRGERINYKDGYVMIESFDVRWTKLYKALWNFIFHNTCMVRWELCELLVWMDLTFDVPNVFIMGQIHIVDHNCRWKNTSRGLYRT